MKDNELYYYTINTTLAYDNVLVFNVRVLQFVFFYKEFAYTTRRNRSHHYCI